MSSILSPSASVGTALGVCVLVVAVHMRATPGMADIRVGDQGNPDIASSERAATWTSAGAVAAVSLLTRDPTIFVLGGLMTIAMAVLTRHSNWVHPMTGKAATAGPMDNVTSGPWEQTSYSTGGLADAA